jgi:hypothetical protein
VAAPLIPSDHADRTECMACHAEGVAGASKVPDVPDHSGLADERQVCAACHGSE